MLNEMEFVPLVAFVSDLKHFSPGPSAPLLSSHNFSAAPASVYQILYEMKLFPPSVSSKVQHP